MTPEQEYEIFIDQTSKLADRRQAVTSTYLPVNAAYLSIPGDHFKIKGRNLIECF